jgi:hypothetical protein
MRFYIIKQAISLLLVSSAVALRGGNVRSSKLVPDTDLTGVIDIGILSATAADVDHQYEVDGQNDHILTTGLEEVSTYVGEVENVETHDNAYIPSLGMTEGDVHCYPIGYTCTVCYTSNGSKYFVGDCGQSTSK